MSAPAHTAHDHIYQACIDFICAYESGSVTDESVERLRGDIDAATQTARLRMCLEWYADQMCEGLCQGKDPRACAAIGADNCAGCPAVVALAGQRTPPA